MLAALDAAECLSALHAKPLSLRMGVCDLIVRCIVIVIVVVAVVLVFVVCSLRHHQASVCNGTTLSAQCGTNGCNYVAHSQRQQQ